MVKSRREIEKEWAVKANGEDRKGLSVLHWLIVAGVVVLSVVWGLII